MYEREPWANLSTGVRLAVIALFSLLILMDLAIMAVGYWIDGWRGAAVFGALLIVQAEFRIFERNPS